jgi:hypothetical protein
MFPAIFRPSRGFCMIGEERGGRRRRESVGRGCERNGERVGCVNGGGLAGKNRKAWGGAVDGGCGNVNWAGWAGRTGPGLFHFVGGEGQGQEQAGPGDDEDLSFLSAEDQPDGPSCPLFEFLKGLTADAAGRDGAVAGAILIIIADRHGIDGNAGIQGGGCRQQDPFGAEAGGEGGILLVGSRNGLSILQPGHGADPEMGIRRIGFPGSRPGLLQQGCVFRAELIGGIIDFVGKTGFFFLHIPRFFLPRHGAAMGPSAAGHER